MAEFASKGVAGTALGTGIAGLSLGVLNSPLLGNVLGGLTGANSGAAAMGGMAEGAMLYSMLNQHKQCGSDADYVTKSELKYVQDLAAKDNEIALLKSEQNTEVKIADVYERIMTRVNADRNEQSAWNASQSVANAQMSAAIAANNASIGALSATLGGITKTVVPNAAICPGWGQVCVQPQTCGGTATST